MRRIVWISLISIVLLSFSTSEKSNWPGFRGKDARGIMDDSNIPDQWNAETSENILWKTQIPGLGHSCPIVWEDKVYVTTAISGNDTEFLKVGLYGNIDAVEDTTVHKFKLYCIDKHSGEILWEQLAHEGVPKTKRHTKGSHANPTPVTDGNSLLAFFGSDGLYCYDMDGKLKWSKSFGKMNAGPYTDPNVEWGFASSPVIYKNHVILQCDFLGDSFIASINLDDGEEVWRVGREEDATWSTPTVIEVNGQAQIIVNGFKHIGSYDFETGERIWWMKGGGDAPVPTPILVDGLIYINSAHGRMSPIYAIKAEAKGDITLGKEETNNEYIKWSIKRGGAYMTSPLVYKGYLYNLKNNGLLSCFEATTGKEIYKIPLRPGGGITASGVASDDRLFFTSELGDVFVVKAGPEFQIVSKNPLGDICMATPAISQDAMYFRTQHYLIAVGKN